jgi:hypothetical protein
VNRTLLALDNHFRLSNPAVFSLDLGSLLRIELCLFFPFYPKVQNTRSSKEEKPFNQNVMLSEE